VLQPQPILGAHVFAALIYINSALQIVSNNTAPA